MSAMTLEKVRDELRAIVKSILAGGSGVTGFRLLDMAESIDAHLTAHAQMVEKVRDVMSRLERMALFGGCNIDAHNMSIECSQLKDKLAAVIGDAK